jgi:hypothetical protein
MNDMSPVRTLNSCGSSSSRVRRSRRPTSEVRSGVRDPYAGGIAGAAHGPELVQGERAHGAAGTDLAEQDRAALVDEHDQRDQPDQRHEREQGEGACAHLDRAADAEVGGLA